MGVLLDTHVAVWWADDPAQLTAGARSAIEDPTVTAVVSAASAWELAIKVRAGKLDVDVRSLFVGLAAQGMRVLGVGVEDAIRAASLRWEHRDPFDRMLVAQAGLHGHTLVTRDRALLEYADITTLTA